MNEYKYLVKYYDALYPLSWYKNWYFFITRVIDKFNLKPKLIIDAGCGTGRLTNIISQNYNVIGFDKSPEMISLAKETFPSLKFFVSKFNKFSLPKNTKADIIVCTFDSLNYLKTNIELDSVFSNFNNNLRPGGILLFDVNGEKAFAWKDKPTTNQKVIHVGKDKIIWKNYFSKKKWVANFEIHRRVNSTIEIVKESHAEYYHSPANIKLILKKNGFGIIRVYNDTKFNEPSNINDRYFFVALKK